MFSLIKNILIGIGIGLLIAPEKGAETRRKIAKLFTDVKEDAKNVVHTSAEKVEAETD